VRAAAAADRIRRQARRLQFENQHHPQLEVLRFRIETLDAEYQKAVLNPAFRVVFEDLWVENHPGPASKTRGAVKSWNSKISFLEDGKILASTVLRVNDPYTFGGYTFYQADWQKKYRDIHLSVWPGVGSEALSAASPAHILVASLGVPITPEWSSSTFVLHDFWPDFKMMGDRFVTLSEDLNNPAGRLVAYDSEGKQIGRAWAFTRQMNELAGHVSNLPYVFLLEGAEAVFESGIQVVHNPGAPLVWVGCLLFTLGMGLAFYVGYIEEWVIQRADGRLTLAIAGNRHHTVLRGVLETLHRELQAGVVPPSAGPEKKENPS
jgi:cytochrome c biogenesis protein